MITSRIASALRKQDWVVVFIELSLVFAGVLISAFAIVFALSLVLSMLGLAVPGSP